MCKLFGNNVDKPTKFSHTYYNPITMVHAALEMCIFPCEWQVVVSPLVGDPVAVQRVGGGAVRGGAAAAAVQPARGARARGRRAPSRRARPAAAALAGAGRGARPHRHTARYIHTLFTHSARPACATPTSATLSLTSVIDIRCCSLTFYWSHFMINDRFKSLHLQATYCIY